MAKYIDVEELKVELDRQKIGYNIDGKHDAEYDTCVKIVRIIDSLQQKQLENPVPADLEEAARKSAIAPFNLDVDEEHLYEYPYLPIAEQKFIEGAKWDREQMIEETVEGEVVKDINNKLVVTAKNVNLDGFKFGEKVRIIIVKENEND